MLVSVSDYRAASGDTTSSDADIEANLTYVQAMVEAFLDRLLDSQEHTETLYFATYAPVILRQWPVATLTSLDRDGTSVDVTSVIVDKPRGVVHHRGTLAWGEEVTVVYTAGYSICPPDLKAVLASLTTARLAGRLDITGPSSARGVKKDTVYGVSSIEYDASSLSKAELEFYPELGPYVRVLERYQRAARGGAVSAHKRALIHTFDRHGVTATYTRLGNPSIVGSIRIANVNYQERPAAEPSQVVQMSMRWVVLADDLAAIGIARPYEGDRIQIESIDLILTVNRYGLRVANGDIIGFDLEATGR